MSLYICVPWSQGSDAENVVVGEYKKTLFLYRWYDFTNMEQRQMFCVSPWNIEFLFEASVKKEVNYFQFIFTAKSCSTLRLVYL